MKKKQSLRRLAFDGILTAVALSIYIVESYIPALIPVPGVKLGLANIVTVVAICLVGVADTAEILFARILLGAVFSGNFSALLYSAAGGVLCFLTMLPLRFVLNKKQVWALSVFGAIAHNIGQLFMASFVLGSFAVFSYLPALLISAIITGLFTGLCAQLVIYRMSGMFDKFLYGE